MFHSFVSLPPGLGELGASQGDGDRGPCHRQILASDRDGLVATLTHTPAMAKKMQENLMLVCETQGWLWPGQESKYRNFVQLC